MVLENRDSLPWNQGCCESCLQNKGSQFVMRQCLCEMYFNENRTFRLFSLPGRRCGYFRSALQWGTVWSDPVEQCYGNFCICKDPSLFWHCCANAFKAFLIHESSVEELYQEKAIGAHMVPAISEKSALSFRQWPRISIRLPERLRCLLKFSWLLLNFGLIWSGKVLKVWILCKRKCPVRAERFS